MADFWREAIPMELFMSCGSNNDYVNRELALIIAIPKPIALCRGIWRMHNWLG